jgi:hypothetical protein
MRRFGWTVTVAFIAPGVFTEMITEPALISNCTEHRTSWALTNQEFPCTSRKHNVRYCSQNSTSSAPITSQMYPFRTLSHNFLWINLNIILPHAPKSSWYFFLHISPPNPPLSHGCHKRRLIKPPAFDHPHNIGSLFYLTTIVCQLEPLIRRARICIGRGRKNGLH